MAPHDTGEHEPDQPRTPESSPMPEVSRRAFLKTVGAAGAVSGVVAHDVTADPQSQPASAQAPPREFALVTPVERPYTRIPQEVAENLVKRGIVGYADRLRVQPGETI